MALTNECSADRNYYYVIDIHVHALHVEVRVLVSYLYNITPRGSPVHVIYYYSMKQEGNIVGGRQHWCA